jgi:hypothetical protein
MTYRAPSRKQMILLFLIVGPVVWPFGLYATSYAGQFEMLTGHGALCGFFILIVVDADSYTP